VAARGPVLEAERVGRAVTELVTDPALDGPAYVLTAAGLDPLP
jgi:hypothetical protein